MYKHKIIEDFKRQINKSKKAFGGFDVDGSYEWLKNSVQFHLNIEEGSLDEMAANVVESDCNSMRFPYEFTLMCYKTPKQWLGTLGELETPVYERAVLMAEFGEHLGFLFFNNYAIADGWFLYPVMFVGNIHNGLNELGYSLLGDYGKLFKKQFKSTEEMEQVVLADCGTDLKVSKVFLDLLDCKNIEVVNNNPSPKLNKKRVKNGKEPLIVYKTLEIKNKNNYSNANKKNLWNNKIHLCRGHFKEYTEKNPLFGKCTGRYWWQPSVRGNKNKGVVMKDYLIKN